MICTWNVNENFTKCGSDYGNNAFLMTKKFWKNVQYFWQITFTAIFTDNISCNCRRNIIYLVIEGDIRNIWFIKIWLAYIFVWTNLSRKIINLRRHTNNQKQDVIIGRISLANMKWSNANANAKLKDLFQPESGTISTCLETFKFLDKIHIPAGICHPNVTVEFWILHCSDVVTKVQGHC